MKAKCFIAGVIAVSISAGLWAGDWPQFRGPEHDGVSPEKISKQWPAEGPKLVWKMALNAGFSSFAVGGGKAFTQVLREVDGANQEVCVALDAASGAELWAVPMGPAKYDYGGERGAPGNDGGDGPRSTPSLDDGRVYVTSSRLVLKCLDVGSGKEIWSKDLIKEFAGRNISWQNAASPLVDGGLVYMAGGGPGQSLLAFDEKDGHVAWKTLSETMTHSTPVPATILGLRQIIFFTVSGLLSVDAKTGAALWRFPFRHGASTAMSPIVSGDIVYCSASYDVGSSACRISRTATGWAANQIWYQPASVIANQWSTPVCSNGYLYGLYGHRIFAMAPLKCVELASGKVMWEKPGFGPGGVTLVDGHVLVLSDAGDLVLVKATPTAYTEVARSHAVTGKCWNAPAVSNGRIYARSTKEGVCLDVSAK